MYNLSQSNAKQAGELVILRYKVDWIHMKLKLNEAEMADLMKCVYIVMNEIIRETGDTKRDSVQALLMLYLKLEETMQENKTDKDNDSSTNSKQDGKHPAW